MSDWIPNLFQYTDYRSFLRDYYTAAKRHIPRFSYRSFAARAGFSSPNFIKLVIDGKRNLRRGSIEKLGVGLGFNSEEIQFFTNLVGFNQADTAVDKNLYFERLTASRKFRQARNLSGELFDYLSHWYYPAVRELAGREDFRDDPSWIAGQLLPSIKPAQAAAALEVLFRLELLTKDDDGNITRGELTVDSGHEVRSLAVLNYHRQMLQQASESLEIVPAQKRDVSAMTVCISPENVAEVKRRLREFREEIMEFCDSDEDPQVVYQINIQLFPMSREAEEEI